MINLDSITNESNKEKFKKWQFFDDWRFSIRKDKRIAYLIKEKNYIGKIYLYAKDLSEPKFKFLMKKREDAGTKHLNDPNAFIECSNTMDGAYENIDGYNPSRKRKILIVFDDMIGDIMGDKKFQAITKTFFIRCRKLIISLVFIMQSYFSVPEDVRLNSKHYMIMKINNRKELQNIAINHSADIDYKYFFWRFAEGVQKNRILFWQLILRYQQITP